MVLMTLSLSVAAQINPGIITTIWSISPLIGALADKIIFGRSFQFRHMIGVFALIGCADCISLSGVLN